MRRRHGWPVPDGAGQPPHAIGSGTACPAYAFRPENIVSHREGATMSAIQRLVTAVLPASWVASLERESRLWIVRCNTCHHATDLWKRGGIRGKAASRTRMYGKCPNCQSNAWHTIIREA